MARDELTAALTARQELGPDYDDAFVAAVVERLQETINERIAASMTGRAESDRENAKGDRAVTITIACVSLGAAIPLTAIAVGAGLIGFTITWACLTMINLAYAMRPRRR